MSEAHYRSLGCNGVVHSDISPNIVPLVSGERHDAPPR
jgi:hypothetical protein